MFVFYFESVDWGIIIWEVSEKKIGCELEWEKFEV